MTRTTSISNQRRIWNTILLCFILSSNSFGQTIFNMEHLEDPEKNGATVSSKLKTIEVDEYRTEEGKCISLKNGFRSAKFINEAEWTAIKDTVEVYRIDVVYSKYPIKNGVYKEIYPLLFNRIKSTLEMDPYLNDSDITWNKVLQTHCVNDAQVNSLFHGVVIWYRPIAADDLTDPPSKLTKINEQRDQLVSEQNTLEELEASIEQILSSGYIPDTLKEALKTRSIDDQIITLRNYLKAEMDAMPDVDLSKSTPEERSRYENEINHFMTHYPSYDTVVRSVLNRHPEWQNSLVINDWTGSMYGYGAQVLEWHLLNFERSGIISITLFNDGDNKSVKPVGETGGIYTEKADNISELVKLFNYVMLKGGGGDGPENDIEGILKAMDETPHFSEIILIADNSACVRDIQLADRIKVPVKVILCGYNPEIGVNPDYVYLANVTGGGIYTIEEDLEEIKASFEGAGEIKTLDDTRFLVSGKKCGARTTPIKGEEIVKLKVAKHHKKTVHRLDISKSELTSIPRAVYKMTHLNYLDLSENGITELSPKIENLEYLKTLNVSKNQLKTLPEEFANIHFIETINLSYNQFNKLPKAILGMKFLLSLDLSFNHLENIDKIYFPKLEELNVSNNELTSIPKSIVKLKNLKKLNLSNNKLKLLPQNFNNLRQLKELDLSNNELSVLPQELFKLKNLEKLNLTGNNFSEEEKARIKKILVNTELVF